MIRKRGTVKGGKTDNSAIAKFVQHTTCQIVEGKEEIGITGQVKGDTTEFEWEQQTESLRVLMMERHRERQDTEQSLAKIINYLRRPEV